MCAQNLTRFGLLALALTLTGCPDRHRRPEQNVTAEEAIARLDARATAIKTLSGMVALEVWRDGERVRLRQLILLARPNKLRVDTLSPFEAPLMMTASDGEVVSVYDLDKKRFMRGPATPNNLARLLSLRMSGEELVAVLGGGVPRILSTEQRIDWDADTGRWVLDLEGVRRRQRIWLAPGGLEVTKTTVWQGGAVQYTVKMGQYAGTAPAEVPQRLRFEVPADKLRVDVEVKDFTLNEDIDAEAFIVDPPGGIEVEPL